MEKYVKVWKLGAACYADAAIYDEEIEVVYFVSLFGRPGVVRAIGAAILQGEYVRIGNTSVKRPSSSLKSMTQNLGDGLCHKIILSPDYFVGSSAYLGRILVGEDKARAFQFLDSIVSTPLKAEWAETLWDKVFEPRSLTGFGSFNGKELSETYLVSLDKDPEDVDDLVLEGIRAGELN